MDSKHAATHGSALISRAFHAPCTYSSVDAMLVCNLEHGRSSVTLEGEVDHWRVWVAVQDPFIVVRIVVIISSDNFSKT